MKTFVTDFEGNYKAYSVTTDKGNAYKGKNYGRAVDIGSPLSRVLTTSEAQTLYGDTVALSVVNPDKWPGKVTLLSADVKLVTLSLTFNEVVRLGKNFAAQHGGAKLSEIPNNGEDALSRAFRDCAVENNLVPLGQYFVSSRSLLESFAPGEMPETEKGMSDACMETPNETIALFTDAGEILKDLQTMLLFNELDFPGYASTNRYYVSGLFAGSTQEAKLPVAAQDKAPLAMVLPELRRTMK